MAPLLDVSELTVELPTPGGWVRPVQQVSLTLAPGESLGLVGESGSGKTMLALALVGLLPQGARRGGQAWLSRANSSDPIDLVSLGERGLRHIRGREIGFVFQEPMTALNPVMRIGAQIGEAVLAHQPRLGKFEVSRRVHDALGYAHVPDPELRARQFPHQLSGGLRQRAMIAMALAAHPRLLVADEPTTALDVTVQKEILELLLKLRRDLGLALLFITHDLGVVAQVADRVAVLYAGRIVESGPTAELLRHPRHPYTEGLLKASPQLESRGLAPIPGMVPALDALPPGCAFEPRCTYRQEPCSARMPELRGAGPDHSARCILVAEP
jgi:oligopeptide/dipeptide ABC transporter ATP-binding protein